MKNFKFKWLLLSIILSIASINTVWAGTKRVYCKVTNGTWLEAGAKVNIHYTGGSSSTSWPGTSMTASGTSNVYYADIPDNSTAFNFVRVNPNNSSEYWGHNTGDKSFPASPASGLSLYEITGSGEPSAGQWANIGFESTGGNDIKYYYSGNASDQTWDISSASGASATRDLGTITSLFLKGWDMKMYQNMDAAIVDGTTNRWLYYNIHRSAVSPGVYSSKTLDEWNWPNWDGGYRKPYGSKSCNDNLLTGLGSGIYSMTFYLQHNGLINFYLNNGGSNYNLKWTIGVPAMATHVVTSDGTGSGTDGSPFNMAVGSTLTITVSGTQASSDANSVLYVSFDNGSSYSSTTTKSISITNTTKSYVQIKAKYYNSADDLSGTVYDFGKVYYQGTVTPSLAISSFTQDESTVTAANSGSTVTINASRQNAGTATITYAYSTDNSNWTTIASTTSTTQSWTLPDVTSTTTYYVKASMTYESTGYNDTETITVYGKKTIKVKNTNGWATMLMHRWGGDRTATTWPGESAQISAFGTGQWKQVVLYSSNTTFALVDGSNNSNHTADLTYASSVSDGLCYEIGSGTGGSLTLTSTANCPAKPTVSASAATSVHNTTATINGSISNNGNDNITDYGFYWSKDYSTAAALQSSGTKVQKGTSNYTGSITQNLTTLTANTTYYYIVYATNGQGTTLSSVQNFTTPYKVTITKPTGCSAITPGTGTQYVKVGDNITATRTAGYTFSSWSATYVTLGTPSTTDGVTTSAITAISADNGTIQPVYTENMTTVALTNNGHGHVEIGGATVTSTTAGVATTRSITAVPDAGYYFSGWEVVSGSDFSVAGTGEANATTTLTGGGAGEGSGQTLKANFTELNKIYFRNVFTDGVSEPTHWSRVYVYFGITWDGKKAHTNSESSYKVQMTQITGTDVYWAYVPRAYTNAIGVSDGKVGFSDTNFNTNYTFYNATPSGSKAATRGDYKNALNMFVPYHEAKETDENGVDYYDNGYWMKYDTRANQDAGYYLKKFDSKGNYSIDSVFRATNDDATFIQCRLRIDDPTATLKYMITSAGGLNYIADEAITTANCTGVGVSENLDNIAEKEVYFSLTTSSEGFYTFVLDQSGDKMKLDVIYPVSVGDYKLVHEYNDGSAKTSHSDIIKAADASGTTVSMYLNMDAATKSLKLYKCTAITAGVPTWGSNTTVGTGDGLFNTTTFNKGKGVYVFDVAITSNAVSSISNAGLYEGNYYIKTDCAPGGWANYKQNILKENTVNASDYDYYMCKWIGNTTTNVKCVIANDYNNEISDTLKSDAILTRSAIAYQTLPEAGSVRFSYNSATNELKRTYLLGGTTQVKIEPLDDYVYGSSSGSDEYTTSTNFTDCGNWMYRLEAYVYPGATAGIFTNYPTSNPTKEQLVPTTFTLMGGESKGSTRYNVQLIYDFQTNELVSAYIANGEVSSAIDLNSNFLYVRNGTSASTQLSFTGEGKLTNVKHAYGVFEFPKDEMSGQMDSWTDNSNRAYERCRYYFSFPFDVRVSDIFGVGEFGTHYIIQKYNGAKRAKVGWFMEFNTFWETVSITDTLNANEGYCLMLDRKAFNSTADDGVWTNIGSGQSTYLYFPSTSGSLGTIDATGGSYDIDSLSCKINRSWTTAKGTKNHMTTDSNWRIIGMPAYANAYSDGGTNPFESCYKYDPSDNSWKTYSVANKANPLQSMHAYMIQWAGIFDWTTTAPTPVAARQPQNTTNTLITLNLMKDGTARDWTYVKLQDGADSDFVLNEDMCKVVNGGIPNIYTYAGSYDAGYNKVPAVNQTIPVGVIIRADGEYTFSMPANIAGTVTLVDTNTGTRTNLALNDYTVELESGTIDDRFYLEIDLTNVVTAIDGATGEGEGTLKDGKAHKFIQNGVMYILRDGQIYSTDGQMVK